MLVSRHRVRRVDPELTRLAVFVETGTGDIEQITGPRGCCFRVAGGARRGPGRGCKCIPLPCRMRRRGRRACDVTHRSRIGCGTPLGGSRTRRAVRVHADDRDANARSGRLHRVSSSSAAKLRAHPRPRWTHRGVFRNLMPSEGEWPPRPGTLAEAFASAGGERIELARRLAEVALIWTASAPVRVASGIRRGRGTARRHPRDLGVEDASPALCVMDARRIRQARLRLERRGDPRGSSRVRTGGRCAPASRRPPGCPAGARRRPTPAVSAHALPHRRRSCWTVPPSLVPPPDRRRHWWTPAPSDAYQRGQRLVDPLFTTGAARILEGEE